MFFRQPRSTEMKDDFRRLLNRFTIGHVSMQIVTLTTLRRWLKHSLRRIQPRVRHAYSAMSWNESRVKLPQKHRSLLETIRKDGIAITHVEELGWQSQFDALSEVVSELLAAPMQASPKKKYLYPILEPGGQQADPDDIFLRFSLQPLPLQLASNYLRCFARLYGNELWLNVPIATAASDAQLWHRDPGDSRLFKMFVAFSELTLETGAFYYIPGSHEFGERSSLSPPEFHDGKTNRTNDDQMRAVVPESKWRICTGRRGTVILADTRGYHKGGLVERGERVLLQTLYTRHLYYKRPVVPRVRAAPHVTSPLQSWAVT